MSVDTYGYKRVRFNDPTQNANHFYSILDNLYVSDQITTFNEELLESKHITYLINLTKSTPFLSMSTKNIHYHFLNDSNFTNETIHKINHVVHEIFNLLSQKQNVLVYCENGSSKSFIILACFLMKYYDSENIINIDHVLRFIKWKTKQTITESTPNFSLIEQYRAYLLNSNQDSRDSRKKISFTSKKQQKQHKIVSIVRNHFS